MSDTERQRIEEALRQAELQEQKNRNLVRIIQQTDPKDLEEERFKNLSDDERRIFRK